MLCSVFELLTWLLLAPLTLALDFLFAVVRRRRRITSPDEEISEDDAFGLDLFKASHFPHFC
jgi:hypothetical protein